MKGEVGDMGLPGDNGIDGVPGIDGRDGDPGPPGFNGTDGLPGAVGPQVSSGIFQDPPSLVVPGPAKRGLISFPITHT